MTSCPCALTSPTVSRQSFSAKGDSFWTTVTLAAATLRFLSTQSQALRRLSGTPRSGTKTVSHTGLSVRIRAAFSPYHALARTRVFWARVAAVAHLNLFWVLRFREGAAEDVALNTANVLISLSRVCWSVCTFLGVMFFRVAKSHISVAPSYSAVEKNVVFEQRGVFLF